jgi:hypothetical protein
MFSPLRNFRWDFRFSRDEYDDGCRLGFTLFLMLDATGNRASVSLLPASCVTKAVQQMAYCPSV